MKEEKMTSNNQVVKNLVFNIISFGLNFIISFCFTPYLINLVGKEAYSFFPLVNNIIGYSSIITSAVGSMAGRFITIKIYNNDINGANGYLNSVWIANIALSVFFTIVAIFLILFLTSILQIPDNLVSDVRYLFFWGCLSLIIGLFTSIMGVGTYVKNRVDLQASLQMFSNLVRVFFILLLFYVFNPSIVFMSISAFMAAIVGGCINITYKRKLLPELTIAPKKYFSWSLLKETTFSGVWNSINQLSNVLLQQLDLFIANVLIGVAATGDFSISKTAPLLIYNLLAMLSGAFIPQFNILYAKGLFSKLLNQIKQSMKIVSLLIGIPIGFILIYGENFFMLWVPSQDHEILYKLSCLTVLPMIFGGSVNPIFGVFTVTNKLKIPSLVLLITGTLNAVVTIIVIKTTSLGLFSIPIVAAVQAVIRNTFFTPVYGAICLGKKYSTFFPSLGKGILGMMIVVIVSLVFRFFISCDTWMLLIFHFVLVTLFSILINYFLIFNNLERKAIFSMVLLKLKK